MSSVPDFIVTGAGLLKYLPVFPIFVWEHVTFWTLCCTIYVGLDVIGVPEALPGFGGSAFAPAGQEEWECWLAAGHTTRDGN